MMNDDPIVDGCAMRSEENVSDFDRMWLHLLTCIGEVSLREPLRTDDGKIPLSDTSCQCKLCNVIHGKCTTYRRRFLPACHARPLAPKTSWIFHIYEGPEIKPEIRQSFSYLFNYYHLSGFFH